MAEEDRQIVTERTTETVPAGRSTAGASSLAAQIIWFLAGLLETFLALRFIFRLLGANPSNGIAHFIYSVSHPFVAPFFGLFNYSENLANGRFEFETIVAMLIYGLIAWFLVWLVSLSRRP